jgi:hypothetical protein
MGDVHDHSDDGGHAGHAHGVSADVDTRALAITLGLIVGFMAVDVGVGVIAHSLALLADAAHMLTDAQEGARRTDGDDRTPPTGCLQAAQRGSRLL